MPGLPSRGITKIERALPRRKLIKATKAFSASFLHSVQAGITFHGCCEKKTSHSERQTKSKDIKCHKLNQEKSPLTINLFLIFLLSARLCRKSFFSLLLSLQRLMKHNLINVRLKQHLFCSVVRQLHLRQAVLLLTLFIAFNR